MSSTFQARKTSADSASLDIANARSTPAPGRTTRTSGLSGGSSALQLKAASDAEPAAQSEGQSNAADNITIEDVRYEVIAHNFGYRDSLAGAPGELLQSWGYEAEWASKINDAQTGLFCGLIMPSSEHPELTPIVVFRGTEGGADFGDLISDINPIAVGRNQFQPNRPFIQQMISEAGGQVDVTGHSLGGALAQHCAAAFTGSVNRIFTFQSPAIEASGARRVAESGEGPDARHHLAKGDLVDNAGDSHLAGEFFRHDVGGGPASHVRYLMSTPEFASQREELGIDDAMLKRLGIDQQQTKAPIEQGSEYPDPILGGASEAVRRVFGLGLFPVLNGLDSMFSGDDGDISERVADMAPQELGGMPVSERSYMIGRLCRGMTGDRDEDAILNILRASTSDAAAVIDVVGAHELAENLHGAQFEELSEFFRAHYYPRASQDSLLTLIQNCMDGRTSEWEEVIIADILVSRPDGRALIGRIGAVYSGGGFSEGLNKVQWQLTGAEQRRVDSIYAR